MVNPDRLDIVCREDMNAVRRAITEIREALDGATRLLGPQTWTGPPADRWSAEFAARVAALKRLLDSAEAETHRLVNEAAREQRRLDAQRAAAMTQPGA